MEEDKQKRKREGQQLLFWVFRFSSFSFFSHFHFTSVFDLVGNVCIMDFWIKQNRNHHRQYLGFTNVLVFLSVVYLLLTRCLVRGQLESKWAAACKKRG